MEKCISTKLKSNFYDINPNTGVALIFYFLLQLIDI